MKGRLKVLGSFDFRFVLWCCYIYYIIVVRNSNGSVILVFKFFCVLVLMLKVFIFFIFEMLSFVMVRIEVVFGCI